MNTPCRMPGCPGHYEHEPITQALRSPDARVLVVEAIPAEVCDFCGDTLIGPDAAEALERLKAAPPAPRTWVPLYHLPTAAGDHAAVGDSRADGGAL